MYIYICSLYRYTKLGFSDLVVILSKQASEWKDEWGTAQGMKSAEMVINKNLLCEGMFLLSSLDALNCLNAYLNYPEGDKVIIFP